ncbi:MAG TPA: aminotransferase class IV [Desulfobacterales bacterium]|nr:aminotransferase class IV [Desulfobacterales bacterium]
MNYKTKVWFNGKMIPWKEATVPLLSHGFSRGSAIFEVFGIHESPDGPVAFRMDEHLKRLMKSASLLGMEMAYSTDEIVKAVTETVKTNDLGRGLIKMLAYWGEEAIIDLVLESKLDLAIFAIPASKELGMDKNQPITACLSKWRKIHPETVPVAAKASSNYLNGYLARRDAFNRGFEVGLMLGTDGFLAEGSIESVFLVKNGTLKTPPLGRVLNSITRLSILQAAPMIGIPTSEEPILQEELFTADEIFTSHSGIKVSPVARFEDRVLQAPGPITKQVMEQMNNIINFSDDRFNDWFQALT